MVVQQTINSLKEKPHEEKKVVAGGIAIGVVVILLVGWAFLFIKRIQKVDVPTLQTNAVPMDQFDTTFLRETQQQINQLYQADPLQELRDSAAGSGVQQTYQAESIAPGGESVFGAEESDF